MKPQGSVATVTQTESAGASSRQQIGLALSLLGREVLAFHPRLVQLTGSIPAALMLSQSLYWTRKLIERNEFGPFWKTQAGWTKEIALSRHEQDTARMRLRALQFWKEEFKGQPARMYFRVDLDQLIQQIDCNFKGDLDWKDREQVLKLLGKPVLVFRLLADLCHSVTAAILLSHFLGVERNTLRTCQRQDEWNSYKFDSVMSLTGLTRDELIHAREILREHGFLIERRVGVPPLSQWRLSFPSLVMQLHSSIQPMAETDQESSETRVVDQYARNQQSSMRVSSILENAVDQAPSDIIPNDSNGNQNSPQTSVVIQLSGIRQPGNRESGNLEIGNPATKDAEIPKISLPDSRFLYKGLTTGKPTTKTTTTPTPPSLPAESRKTAPSEGGGGLLPNRHSTPELPALLWPNLLLADERMIASRLLGKVGDAEVAQQILDELAGQNALTPIQQPLAYLRKLATQAQSGDFQPSAAMRVAQQRRQQQMRLLEHPQAASMTAIAPAELSPEQRQAARKKLEAMRIGLLRRAPPVSNPSPSSMKA